MAGGLAVLIPAEFDLQFSFHPVFGLGQDAIEQINSGL
jgi:hypothetical protein